jgi:predicted amidohydrolase YtcJ
LHILLLFSLPEVMAQSRPVVIQGGTLIDGTGRSPVTDAIVVFQDGRIRDVGRRSDVKTPEGAEVIDATGKTILPGLIDGHCHLRDWMGELYLHFGITTCPTISNNPTDWVIAQRDGVKNGTIRAQRVWARRQRHRRTAAGRDGRPEAAAHERLRYQRRRGARGGGAPPSPKASTVSSSSSACARRT